MSPHRLLRVLLVISLIGALSAPAPLWAMRHAQATPNAVSLLVPLTDITQFAASFAHTCALTTKGGVKCWGENVFGALGDNTQETNRLTPVDVVGLSSGVKAITANGPHTCALTMNGGVKCWGYNFHGQIGDNTEGTNRFAPVDVVGLASGVKAITAGGHHTCALTTNGGVKCWGSNLSGQIGDNTSGANRLTPVDVVGLASGVTAITAGSFHTCALTTNGGVKCWGSNFAGGIGDNTQGTNRLMPVDVVGLSSGVKAITAGEFHTCALTTDGGVKCWGNNDFGQIGDNSEDTNRLTPVNVIFLSSGVNAIAAGANHTCALTTNGGVKCWGNNSNGETGDNTSGTNRLTPVNVLGLSSSVTALTTGGNHSCAVTISGGGACWGFNFAGQLGNATTVVFPLATDVLTPATCYALTLSHNGSGADPAPTPNRSPGCPLSHYLPDTAIALVSAPAAAFHVQSWTGTSSNQSRDPSNLVTMPAADHSASVTYGVCHPLTRSHTGTGADPIAAPGQSPGCPPSTYAAGDIMTLVAAPNAGARVQSWTGTAQSPAAGDLVNTLTMPNAAATVSVSYEPCLTLTASIQGQGQLLQATPNATFGCDPSSYIAGQTVTLLAAPAPGWRVAAWSGTANDQSTATTNAVVMTTHTTVGVTYQPVAQNTNAPVYLPGLAR